jgi:uncharacterized membrane protein
MEIAGKPYVTANVGKSERAVSIMAGSMLAYYGAKKRDAWGAAMALAGAGLLRRGFTGYCYTYQAFGVRTAEQGQGEHITLPYDLGIKVERSITINKPREEVFQFWRKLDNLPVFMKHLKSVKETGENTSRWVAHAPRGRTVEWDAEIINEIPGELIAWRSLAGARVPNAGSVHFVDAPQGRGTEVHVSLQFNPPGGPVGAWVAKLFGEDTETRIAEDLRRLKAVLEAGQLPTNSGQASARPKEHMENGAKKRSHEQALQESFPASDPPSTSYQTDK